MPIASDCPFSWNRFITIQIITFIIVSVIKIQIALWLFMRTIFAPTTLRENASNITPFSSEISNAFELCPCDRRKSPSFTSRKYRRFLLLKRVFNSGQILDCHFCPKNRCKTKAYHNTSLSIAWLLIEFGEIIEYWILDCDLHKIDGFW